MNIVAISRDPHLPGSPSPGSPSPGVPISWDASAGAQARLSAPGLGVEDPLLLTGQQRRPSTDAQLRGSSHRRHECCGRTSGVGCLSATEPPSQSLRRPARLPRAVRYGRGGRADKPHRRALPRLPGSAGGALGAWLETRLRLAARTVGLHGMREEGVAVGAAGWLRGPKPRAGRGRGSDGKGDSHTHREAQLRGCRESI